jgi:holliday junction DNA helicase RuvA
MFGRLPLLMIGRLVGKLVSDDVDGTILLDVNGVGYEVTLPLGAVGRSRAADGTRDLVLHIHTHVREDTFSLYGFASPTEREVFRTLIALPQVGPKLALSVLSALPPKELAAAISANDLKRLNSIHGVGKKTAERLVLELRERLPKLGVMDATLQPVQALPTDDRGRLIGALVNMGYKPIEAEKAVDSVKERLGQEPISDLLRAALQHLAR